MTAEDRARIKVTAVAICTHREAGLTPCDDCLIDATLHAEREACARFLESIEASGDPDGIRLDIPNHHCSPYGCASLDHLVAAIRARGAA